jgi:hypothetical protein
MSPTTTATGHSDRHDLTQAPGAEVSAMTALPKRKTNRQLPTAAPAPQGSGHWVAVTWRHGAPSVRFRCYEPRDAWCRRHAVGPGEPPPEDIADCYLTVLASGFDWLSIYGGDPARIDPVCSGAVQFIRGPHGAEDWLWRYAESKPEP